MTAQQRQNADQKDRHIKETATADGSASGSERFATTKTDLRSALYGQPTRLHAFTYLRR